MWLRSSIGGSTLLVLGEGGRDELIADKTLITPDFLNLMTNYSRFLKFNDFIGSKLLRFNSAIFLGGGGK